MLPRFLIVFLWLPINASAGTVADTAEADTADPPLLQTQAGQSVSNQALIELLQSIQALKLEVSQLRGELELQTYNMEQQGELYTALDRRLKHLEFSQQLNKELQTDAEGEPPTITDPTIVSTDAALTEQLPVTDTETVPDTEVDAAPSPASVPAEVTLPVAPETPQPAVTEPSINQLNTAAVPAPVVTETTDADADSRAAPLDPVQAKADYQRAFKLLQRARYQQATEALKAFLLRYPESAFAHKAQYWLAEAHYIMRQFQLAINEYQALLTNYPESQKVADALLKIGLSYAELGNEVEAKKTLQQVINQFPNTTMTSLATERLRQISAKN